MDLGRNYREVKVEREDEEEDGVKSPFFRLSSSLSLSPSVSPSLSALLLNHPSRITLNHFSIRFSKRS